MSPIQYVFRLLIQVVNQPGVSNAISAAGREVSRAATAALIREVSNGFSRYEQKKTTPTVR